MTDSTIAFVLYIASALLLGIYGRITLKNVAKSGETKPSVDAFITGAIFVTSIYLLFEI